VVSTGVSDPAVIAKAETSVGVSVAAAPLQSKESTAVPLPRLPKERIVTGPTLKARFAADFE
jgi:hypothetical protein